MGYLKFSIFIATLFLFLNCSKDTDANEASTIEIGSYIFKFETKFVLEELQGIDSYIGNINGAGITLFFDYGRHTSPQSNLPNEEYLVSEDEINGHYRQIVKPVDSEMNYTQIHLYKISDSIKNPNAYNSLTLSTNKISAAEQEM